MDGSDFLHGIAISKLFHQDIALWRNGIAEGYYRLGVDDIVYAIAWILVASSAIYNLIRMAAGSPRGAKQLLLVGVSSTLLGLTPQIRGDENNVGWLWGFYHAVYSKLYASAGTDANGNPLPSILAGMATGESVRNALKQQIQAMLVLAWLKTEVAGLKGLATPVAEITDNALVKAATGLLIALGAGTGGATLGAGIISAAFQEIVRQVDNLLKKLDEGLNQAIGDLVKVAVNLMAENTLIIYATATIVIFISLFWPLLAALLSFPQTAPAFVTAAGLIPGAILALVMSGVLLLAELAVVFRTTAGVLTNYTEEVKKATEAIKKMQEEIQVQLDQGAKYVSLARELIEGNLGLLRGAKARLEALAAQGQQDPKVTLYRSVCKLQIKKAGRDTKYVVSTIGATNDCIVENQEVDLQKVEEYLNHYENIQRQYAEVIRAELSDPNVFQLNVLERVANGILGTIARLTIQLQIARIMGLIVGAVSALFLIYVASLGTKLGMQFIRTRLGL